MKTFAGIYSGNNYVFSNEAESLRVQLLSILNTPRGSRYYYPDYGSNLNMYRFNVLNHYSINLISTEIKRAISLIDGLTLTDISYDIEDDNTLSFTLEVVRQSSTSKFSISVSDGVAV